MSFWSVAIESLKGSHPGAFFLAKTKPLQANLLLESSPIILTILSYYVKIRLLLR